MISNFRFPYRSMNGLANKIGTWVTSGKLISEKIIPNRQSRSVEGRLDRQDLAAMILFRAAVSRINFTGGERPKVSLQCLAIGNRSAHHGAAPAAPA
ncbi:hypothetical protein KO116_P100099 (plasmid) [Halomonas sp. KO116]|nr:hypothetical protein KO116_P100099 [Halomonas sp. KO116]